MSKLRNQLQQAKHEYESLRYDGDLAAEVLGTAAPVRSGWRPMLAIAAALAVLATATIVYLNRSSTPTNNLPVANNNVPSPKIGPVAPEQGPAPEQGIAVNPDNDEIAIAQNDAAEEIEESWTLVPGSATATEESAVSFVPSFQSVSFALPSLSIGAIDSYEQPEETQTNTVQ